MLLQYFQICAACKNTLWVISVIAGIVIAVGFIILIIYELHGFRKLLKIYIETQKGGSG